MQHVVLFPQMNHLDASRLYLILRPQSVFYEYTEQRFVSGGEIEREDVLYIESSARSLVYQPLAIALALFWGGNSWRNKMCEALDLEGFRQPWFISAAKERRKGLRVLFGSFLLLALWLVWMWLV